MADRIATEGMAPQVDAMLPKLFGPGAPAAAVAQIEATMRATDPVGAAAALRGRAARPDYRPGLRALRMPVFVCTGTEDPYSTAAVTRTILDCVPHATQLSLPGVGHLPNLEAPAAFDAPSPTSCARARRPARGRRRARTARPRAPPPSAAR